MPPGLQLVDAVLQIALLDLHSMDGVLRERGSMQQMQWHEDQHGDATKDAKTKKMKRRRDHLAVTISKTGHLQIPAATLPDTSMRKQAGTETRAAGLKILNPRTCKL